MEPVCRPPRRTSCAQWLRCQPASHSQGSTWMQDLGQSTVPEHATACLPFTRTQADKAPPILRCRAMKNLLQAGLEKHPDGIEQLAMLCAQGLRRACCPRPPAGRHPTQWQCVAVLRTMPTTADTAPRRGAGCMVALYAHAASMALQHLNAGHDGACPRQGAGPLATKAPALALPKGPRAHEPSRSGARAARTAHCFAYGMAILLQKELHFAITK